MKVPLGTQLDALPRLVRSYQPFPEKRSAYAKGRAVADDGVAYIVKADRGDRPICATEWICSAVAESLNLPVPSSTVLKMPDGHLLYGSAELTERLSDYELGELLFTGHRPNDLQIGNLRGLLSRIYAYDLFVGNHDRHAENLLMAIAHTDERSMRTGQLHAIDFDSADIVTRREIRLPMVPGSHTIKAARGIRKVHQFDNQQADDLLTRLVKGREFMFEQAMYGLPKEWLSDTDRVALLNRVRSEPFEIQIRQLQQGLSDGSYL